jgi:SAM-dependent methyltransferase
MIENPETFYNRLAADYHFIFADWRKSILRQSEALDRLIRTTINATGRTVLDCSCGIGTQAIGLAVRGYTVHATDISPQAVDRARQEAQAHKVSMTFGVADFRALHDSVEGCFDVVLSCDNSLAHMLTPDDLTQALSSMRSRLNPGGLLLLSIRDYDQAVLDKPRATLPVVTEGTQGRSVVFQVWDWAEDGISYTLNHFTLRQDEVGWQTECRVTQLRAWQRAEMDMALAQAGLTDITWHMPPDTGYHQPIVTARPA